MYTLLCLLASPPGLLLSELPYFAVHNVHAPFGPKFSGKKILHFNCLIQFFICLYLDTCFLYYKGILAFIFEHIIVQEILWNK